MAVYRMVTQTFREKKQFLAQHSVAMLEQCCNYSKQCRNNVALMLQRCVALKIFLCNITFGHAKQHCRRAKQRQRKVQKRVLHVPICLFCLELDLLILLPFSLLAPFSITLFFLFISI